MDVLLSSVQDDTVVPEAHPFIETSNDVTDVEPPVFRLPTELMIFIFRQCRSHRRPPIALTHVCRRWRHIAINSASLWTNIFIHAGSRQKNVPLDNVLSFLGMQLDRTANLLLDVEWFAHFGDDFLIASLQLIREKAPFSRWRRLMILPPDDGIPWSPVDVFTNLQSLVVLHLTKKSMINVLGRMVTPRLDILELRTSEGNFMTIIAKSLNNISSLVLRFLDSTEDMACIPANVVKLQLYRGTKHPFPHIQTYELEECIFSSTNGVSLRSMTTLVVRGPLTIRSPVILPALRKLSLGALHIDTNTEIEAPKLDTLQFTDYISKHQLHTSMERSLSNPGYLLSPNTSLSIDLPLSSTTLTAVLTKSPKVTNATLRFDDWATAQAVLGRLLAFIPEENGIFCPRLSVLRLNFNWGFSEPSASKQWLSRASKSRKKASKLPPLTIYAGWKGEGTYAVLTGC